MTDQEICGACDGSRRMPRDPDIGTDQECFVCDGSGVIAAHAAKAAPAVPFCYASVNKQGDVTSTHKHRDSWRTVPLYTAPAASPAPAVPQGLPAFDELDDEVIDAACTVSSLYRVDLMLAYERIRAMLAATTAAQSQPAVPQEMRLVPVWLLERVERSLGSFTSDEGWAQADMDKMDSVSALLAAPSQEPVTLTDEEIKKAWVSVHPEAMMPLNDKAIDRIRAIIAALREKEARK